MANTKKIFIKGSLPFNYYSLPHDGLSRCIAYLVSPTSGLKLTWGNCHFKPIPETNGKLAIYDFTLEGKDSLSWAWLDNFKKLVIQAGGTISDDKTVDPN